MTAIYVSSALGFTEAGWQYYRKLLERLRDREGFDVLDPWSFENGESTKERQTYAELAGGEMPLQVCAEIGARNVNLVEQADIMLAVLDGTDVDSGVACEVGYAMARDKPIIGLRTDRRRSGDCTGVHVNLQLLYAVLHHEQSEYTTSLDDAIESLHAAARGLGAA